MKQDDPILIDFIKNNVLVNPYNIPLKLSQVSDLNDFKAMGGQFKQPFEVEKVLGLPKSHKKEKKGFFIEAGAAGGETFSNTLFFELKYGWTGLDISIGSDREKIDYFYVNYFTFRQLFLFFTGKKKNGWADGHGMGIIK